MALLITDSVTSYVWHLQGIGQLPLGSSNKVKFYGAIHLQIISTWEIHFHQKMRGVINHFWPNTCYLLKLKVQSGTLKFSLLPGNPQCNDFFACHGHFCRKTIRCKRSMFCLWQCHAACNIPIYQSLILLNMSELYWRMSQDNEHLSLRI